MKIKRTINGAEHEFELTQTELMLAYYEQQHNYDTQDVLDMIEGMRPQEIEEEFGVCEAEFVTIAPMIADQMRGYLDSGQVLWYDAREEAVYKVTEDYRKSRSQEDAD